MWCYRVPQRECYNISKRLCSNAETSKLNIKFFRWTHLKLHDFLYFQRMFLLSLILIVVTLMLLISLTGFGLAYIIKGILISLVKIFWLSASNTVGLTKYSALFLLLGSYFFQSCVYSAKCLLVKGQSFYNKILLRR